jgi:transposase
MLCALCGNLAVRHGTKARNLLDVAEDGVARRAQIRVQRWRCTGCGASTTELPGDAKPRSLATIAGRDAVAEACFTGGYAQAAQRFGMDEKTARALWHDWAEPRERELPQRPPDFMGLHLLRVAGADRTLVTDVCAMTVVDIIETASTRDIVDWLEATRETVRIDSVALDVHQPFRQAMAACAPRARLLVCPAHSRSRGMSAFLSAFRVAMRTLGRNCTSNVREDPRTFATHRQELSTDQREVMAGWNEAVGELYAVKERFYEALECSQAADAQAILGDAQRWCSQLPFGRTPQDLLASWGGEMAAGAGHGGVAEFEAGLGRMAHLWSARRPPLPFDLARGLAVLQDGPRIMAEDPEEGTSLTLGVAMQQVAEMLVR